MSKRQPLPYHCSQARDEAVMAIANAKRILRELIKTEHTLEEFWRLMAQLSQNIDDTESALLKIEPAQAEKDDFHGTD